MSDRLGNVSPAMRNHPNATMAGYSGAAATILIYIFSLLGLELPPEIAAAMATVIIGGILLLGKRKPDEQSGARPPL